MPRSEPLISSAPVEASGDADSVLLQMSVNAEPGLYVLGSYESRVTIYSQQIRAFNLAYALASTNQLGPNSRVAVIGGGVAGVTFAAAASSRGASVTLFERRPELVHLLRGCYTRHVHPYVYDWPAVCNPMRDDTDLPFMNWCAASAADVARQLLKQFQRFKSAVNVRVGTTVLVRGGATGNRRLTVTVPRLEELSFDSVVLAVGFGLETTLPPQALHSYWRDDSLHQPEMEERAGGRTNYLVSGNGDGGLIDLLRLRISDFRHETLLAEITASADLTELASNLQGVENEARSDVIKHRSPGRTIYEGYRNLCVPSELDAHLVGRLRHDTHVTFNYSNWPLSLRSSILHRLLVSRLLQIDAAIEALPGRLISVEGHEPALRCIVETDTGRIERHFHRAVIRHGPRSSLGECFPSLHARLEPGLRARNALDTTRRKAWPPGFFDPPSTQPPSGTPPPTAPSAGAVDTNSTPSPPPGEPPSGGAPTGSPSKDVVEDSASRVVVLPATPAVETVSTEARQLRDMLLGGDGGGIEAKLGLLSDGERRFIVRSLAERALEDENVLRGIRHLLTPSILASDMLEKDVVCRAITEILRRAAFTQGTPRKVRTLELSPDLLSLANQGVLRAFFEDLFDIIDRNQFDEVNALMPALALVQDAIPADLHSRYFQTLMRQARSSSYQGAPAAKRALATLPDDIASVAMKELTAELIGGFSNAEILRPFVTSHRKLIPPEKEELLKDLIDLSNRKFREKYDID